MNEVTYTVGATPEDTFVVPFQFWLTGDLEVTLGGVPTFAFSTAGNGQPSGGSISLDTAVSDTVVYIRLSLQCIRIGSFPTYGEFRIEALNAELDRIIAMLCETDNVTDPLSQRAFRYSEDSEDFDPTWFTGTNSAGRATKVVGFDADGNTELKEYYFPTEDRAFRYSADSEVFSPEWFTGTSTDRAGKVTGFDQAGSPTLIDAVSGEADRAFKYDSNSEAFDPTWDTLTPGTRANKVVGFDQTGSPYLLEYVTQLDNVFKYNGTLFDASWETGDVVDRRNKVLGFDSNGHPVLLDMVASEPGVETAGLITEYYVSTADQTAFVLTEDFRNRAYRQVYVGGVYQAFGWEVTGSNRLVFEEPLEEGLNVVISGSASAGNITVTLADGTLAPPAEAEHARLFVDQSDGALKIIFGDGNVKTIVAND